VKTATLKRLLLLARPEWRLLGMGLVFLALGSAMGLLYPQGIRIIIDGVLGSGRREMVDKAALFMVAVALVQGIAISLRFSLISVSGERAVTRIREQLFSRILDQEIGFFDERRTGELTNRLSSDTSVLQSAVSANISIGLRSLAQVVGSLAFLFWTSPVLTLLMLAVVPPVAVGAMVYGRRVRKLSRDVQDALASASEVAEEAISGIRTVRSFTAEAAESTRYSGKVRHAYDLAKKRVYAGAAFMAAASFAAYAAAALVFWYGGRLVVRGEMTVGGLTSFLVYTLIVAFSLGALADLWADFMRALGAAERVFELLDRKPSMAPSGGAQIERVHLRAVGGRRASFHDRTAVASHDPNAPCHPDPAPAAVRTTSGAVPCVARSTRRAPRALPLLGGGGWWRAAGRTRTTRPSRADSPPPRRRRWPDSPRSRSPWLRGR